MVVESKRTRLAAVMFHREISQVDLSEISGVSRKTLWHAYHGGSNISIDTWVRLATALGVTVAEIAPPDVAARLADVT